MIHSGHIPLGVRGEISKIEEELAELKDVQTAEHSAVISIIECADIIESVGQFSLKKFYIPLTVIFIFAVIRRPYKILRNIVLDICGKPKESFFHRDKSP